MLYTKKYHAMTRVLHWAMAVIIIAVWCGGHIRGWFPKGSDMRSLVTIVHMQFGMSILVLLLPRLFYRLTQAAPPILPPMTQLNALLAKLGHLALYALMILVPLVGVMMVQSGGKDVLFLGLSVPPMVLGDKDLHHNLEEMHELLANAILILGLLHAAVAVWHHRKMKDNTLIRML